jgi:hypothetical protein
MSACQTEQKKIQCFITALYSQVGGYQHASETLISTGMPAQCPQSKFLVL